ncbi:unnamed protein product [Polarella glacialis]|uniref:Uncharacterized protein n=1 Tax=Polarella glacialis TaxID=89957 RepID=A0A813LEB4_POLGL|nr:unnamed protein product [Polarella glacialis]
MFLASSGLRRNKEIKMEITTNKQLFTTVVFILIVLYQNDCLAGTLILLRRLRPPRRRHRPPLCHHRPPLRRHRPRLRRHRPRLEDGAWRQTVSHGPRPLLVFCALARHLSTKQLLTSVCCCSLSLLREHETRHAARLLL